MKINTTLKFHQFEREGHRCQGFGNKMYGNNTVAKRFFLIVIVSS
ncbi:hypothetical protein [Chryseobacterium chendengshani]|nr:hypothetical protein [Chryseobacterium sp. LJ668]